MIFEDIEKCFSLQAELLKALSFIPFGLASVFCNGVLIVAILRSRNLRSRREMRVITALSVTEFVEAFATLLGGCYRTAVIIFGTRRVRFTLLQCMALPHSWLWRWSDFATAFMLLSLTVDRLLSVTYPIRYFVWGRKYSVLIIGLPYGISLVFALFAWYYPVTTKGELSMLCSNVYLSIPFYSFSKYVTSVASVISILIYVPLLYLTRRQLMQISDKLCSSQFDCQRRAQLRMTVTVAISCCLTLFLDAIPRAIGVYGATRNGSSSQCESAMMVLFHLTKVKSVLNLILYYQRSKDVRNSIRDLFSLKTEDVRGRQHTWFRKMNRTHSHVVLLHSASAPPELKPTPNSVPCFMNSINC